MASSNKKSFADYAAFEYPDDSIIKETIEEYSEKQKEAVKPLKQAKDKRVNVRMSEEQFYLLKAKATAENLSLSDYIRKLLNSVVYDKNN